MLSSRLSLVALILTVVAGLPLSPDNNSLARRSASPNPVEGNPQGGKKLSYLEELLKGVEEDDPNLEEVRDEDPKQRSPPTSRDAEELLDLLTQNCLNHQNMIARGSAGDISAWKRCNEWAINSPAYQKMLAELVEIDTKAEQRRQKTGESDTGNMKFSAANLAKGLQSNALALQQSAYSAARGTPKKLHNFNWLASIGPAIQRGAMQSRRMGLTH
ncbi:MAG: hypothetical protein M1823_000742 [Watsoniomyces obsoletus]|nr:MAG: hypothetical protein M1823_000742 [Watsoniomyces obsoletus]